ncbi:hypothetical protein PAXRUDRAFT_719118 [Paxillus rubicundulus Ve08.2h10]|uniref:Uncharacterized protein n=1 Tax=Paxillus rubicundulus Ve08.2h10 TaxID=930991 RepID=A0A0D0C8G4_9AGAM|nr:hypothetical protein PAXRUDRAFT_289351 [Paxillus rubicundulus Ve08.2h10]KIK82330.1 hypothetical protein PAXRUDRAFT_719118 [Paxillus rubicundulus Ve08.2h10]
MRAPWSTSPRVSFTKQISHQLQLINDFWREVLVLHNSQKDIVGYNSCYSISFACHSASSAAALVASASASAHGSSARRRMSFVALVVSMSPRVGLAGAAKKTVITRGAAKATMKPETVITRRATRRVGERRGERLGERGEQRGERVLHP